MKKRNYAYIFIGGLICSSCLFNRKVNINGHVFETLKKHAYGSSKIIFHKDSSYIFLGQGPSVLLSKGKWSYNYFENEISFKASSPDSNFLSSISMDTIWVDISNKKGKFLSKNKIYIDNIAYYKKK